MEFSCGTLIFTSRNCGFPQNTIWETRAHTNNQTTQSFWRVNSSQLLMEDPWMDGRVAERTDATTDIYIYTVTPSNSGHVSYECTHSVFFFLQFTLLFLVTVSIHLFFVFLSVLSFSIFVFPITSSISFPPSFFFHFHYFHLFFFLSFLKLFSLII
jgi:hypothetical protein